MTSAANSEARRAGIDRARFAGSVGELAVDELPVLPVVVVRLMGLSPESGQFFDEVLNIASEDPGLALRVIRNANSFPGRHRRSGCGRRASLPDLGGSSSDNALTVTAGDLARVLPDILAARTRAIRDLGLVAS